MHFSPFSPFCTLQLDVEAQKTHQVALVKEQKHVLVRGILLQMMLKIATSGSQRIPSIQDLELHTQTSSDSAAKMRFRHTYVHATKAASEGAR